MSSDFLTFWLSESASGTDRMICTKDDVVHRDYAMSRVKAHDWSHALQGTGTLTYPRDHHIECRAGETSAIGLTTKVSPCCVSFHPASIRHFPSLDGRGRRRATCNVTATEGIHKQYYEEDVVQPVTW